MKIKIMIICLLLISSLAWADNNVVIHINYPADTVYIGAVNVLEIWLENDFDLVGMSMGFEFTSYTGDVIWDTTYGNYPPANLENDMNVDWAVVAPIGYGFDNSYLPDSLQFDAVSIPYPALLAKGLRKCATLHFSIPSGESDGSLCIDNIIIPPTGQWVFGGSSNLPPDYFGCVNASQSDPDCPAVCFPVVERDDLCGDMNDDGVINIGDPMFLLNYIFYSGAPAPSFIVADVNCNGRINVGDIEYILDYIFSDSDAPCANCLK